MTAPTAASTASSSTRQQRALGSTRRGDCDHDGVPSTHRHPLFARLYPRISHTAEQRGGAEHRRALLEGLQGRVVEIGAGHGLNFAYYPQGVTHVLAVEPEPHLCALAQRASETSPVSVQVTRAIAEALPVEDAGFDAAVVSLVLCTVSDQAAASAGDPPCPATGGRAALLRARRIRAPRRRSRPARAGRDDLSAAGRRLPLRARHARGDSQLGLCDRARGALLFQAQPRCTRHTPHPRHGQSAGLRFTSRRRSGPSRADHRSPTQRSSRDSLRSLSTRPSVWQAGQ